MFHTLIFSIKVKVIITEIGHNFN